mgnify:CR=1 FL=1
MLLRLDVDDELGDDTLLVELLLALLVLRLEVDELESSPEMLLVLLLKLLILLPYLFLRLQPTVVLHLMLV